MTRKKRRLYTLLLAGLGLGTATALALSAFEENMVFFYSPSDLITNPPGERSVRVGGLVEEGSIDRQPDGLTTVFRVTDTANTVAVTYTGILPDLFREGQGVVAAGSLRADGVFAARDIMARHDETYMPPEVAEALKKAGQFKPEVPGRSVYEATDTAGTAGHATDTLRPN